jgi:hypothetical protein
VLSVAMTDGIIGCPHQEGIDYDRAASCKRGWQRLSVALGHRVLADCWLLSSEPLKAFLSRDMRRSEGTRARRSQTISWMSYRTLWDGVSVTPILQS